LLLGCSELIFVDFMLSQYPTCNDSAGCTT